MAVVTTILTPPLLHYVYVVPMHAKSEGDSAGASRHNQRDNTLGARRSSRKTSCAVGLEGGVGDDVGVFTGLASKVGDHGSGNHPEGATVPHIDGSDEGEGADGEDGTHGAAGHDNEVEALDHECGSDYASVMKIVNTVAQQNDVIVDAEHAGVLRSHSARHQELPRVSWSRPLLCFVVYGSISTVLQLVCVQPLCLRLVLTFSFLTAELRAVLGRRRDTDTVWSVRPGARLNHTLCGGRRGARPLVFVHSPCVPEC